MPHEDATKIIANVKVIYKNIYTFGKTECSDWKMPSKYCDCWYFERVQMIKKRQKVVEDHIETDHI